LIDANRDADGIISPRLLDTLSRKPDPSVPGAISMTTRPYAPSATEFPSSFGNGMDVFTNSPIAVDGRPILLLAPWIFTLDDGALKRPLAIYAISIPQDPSAPLCKFVMS
jgi:hypothetical protein